MITNPTPTQRPPQEQPPAAPKKAVSTPRKRTGESSSALFIKALLRPIFKGLYYFINAIRKHKLVTLIAIILLLVSATAVNFYETGQWPLGIGYDQFNFQVHGTNAGGDQVKDWLYALRDGDASTLAILDRFMSQPPDPQSLVSTFSQPAAHLTWKSINVLGYRGESDSTVDSYIEVDLSTNGPGSSTSAYAFFHFVTATLQNGPGIVEVNVEALRPSLS